MPPRFRPAVTLGLLLSLLAAPQCAEAGTRGAAGAVVTARTTTTQTDATRAVDLAAAVDRVLADPLLAGAQAGVTVADARTGDVLVDRAGDRRLLPASTVKLFTSAAAMAVLGPGHRFVTEAATTGVRRGAALDGALHLRGTGDPALTPADLDRLARDVAATGLRSIGGDLVADDTAFDAERLGLEWAWDDESSFAAPVSALSVAPDADLRAGTVTVTVSPAATAGRPPRVTLLPTTRQLTVLNHAVTGGDAPGITVTRRHGTGVLLVTGRIPRGADPVADSVTVGDPTRLTVETFRTALRRHGVRVSGAVVTGRPTPAGASVLARHAGAPLRELLPPLLKLSNNAMAEALIKAIGRRATGVGSWPAGTAAVAAYLAGLGIDVGTLRQVDGSGLSRRNLVSPAAVTRLLVAVRREPWHRRWKAALPVAGNPDPMVGGTLRNRMRGTPAAGAVHAKTGTLTGVAALSGYVSGRDGRPLAFSVMVNNHLAPSVAPVLDRIAVTLAGGPDALPTTRLAPTVPGDRECSWTRPSLC